ncbi:MAG TPA: hypothetical protein VGI04_09835 [Neobacillus sp.]
MTKKTLSILIIPLIVLVGVLLLYYFNSTKIEPPPNKMVKFENINFIFTGYTADFNTEDLELVETVKKQVNSFPEKSFEAYNIDKGTKVYLVLKTAYSKNPDYKGVLVIKNNKNYLIGHPFARNNKERNDIAGWMNKFD